MGEFSIEYDENSAHNNNARARRAASDQPHQRQRRPEDIPLGVQRSMESG